MNMDNANVLLHCHTEYSARDGAMTVKELVETAKVLEAKAVALTDHGNMVGAYEFVDACKEADIKPILGVEAYYCEQPDSKEKSHFILMAKNKDGYKAIIRAVTASQECIYKDAPRMTDAILNEYFGVGSIGHGNVVATSACVSGVIATKLRENETAQNEIRKIRKIQQKLTEKDFDMNVFLDMQFELESKEAEVKRAEATVKQVKDVADMKLAGIARRLKTLTGEEAEMLEKELSEKQAQKEAATELLKTEKATLTTARRNLTAYKKEFQSLEVKANRWLQGDAQIEKIESSFLSDNQLKKSALERAKKFKALFGDDFYMELQYHGIEAERNVMPVLAEIAKELNIPLVAANDAHYATNAPEDIRRRDLLSVLRYPDQVLDDSILQSEGHGEIYLKSDFDLKAALCNVVNIQDAETAMDNTVKIADMCTYMPEYEEHYPKYKGDEIKTAEARLTRLAQEGIQYRYPETWDDEKQKRMESELDVIIGQGYADYLCIVQDYLDYGRNLVQTAFPEQVGYTIGPGRGSAAGSIVCYLVGITDIDPMKYGLLFERFLNKDRVSIPDIDADFHTELRGKVIEYVRSKYGELAVCGIGTKSRMAGRSSIRNAGRITGVLTGLTDTVARLVPAIPNAKIADGGEELQKMCEKNPLVASLIKDAQLIEGRISAYSSHAAGIIISDNENVSDYVPLMKSDTGLVTQCDMGQCEFKAGLNKMDFLGLRNLDIITDTLRRVYRNYGVRIDIRDVPFESEVFAQIFSQGKTNSVFQFESGGMKTMLRQFKPDSFEDLILLVAAYRPGPMQFLDDIIATKHGRKTPKYIAAGLEDILSDTYGKPIYQEQVMQICNKVAGFSLGEADIVRRAMGKKKLSILTDPKTNYQGKFIDGLINAGASEKDATEYWESLLDFASYAFNKSHAACYALISYYTAWLKWKYPAEYMCSVMMRTDSAKLPPLLAECKTMGLQVLAPDINRSDVCFSNDGNQILFGLNDIKGVGNAGTKIVEMRKRDGAFVSVRNFAYRITSGKGALSTGVGKSAFEAIAESGGFDAFCDGNRTAITTKIEEMCAAAKKIKDKEVDIEAKQIERQKILGTDADEKQTKKVNRSYENAIKSRNNYKAAFDMILLTQQPENKDQRLAKEKERMGIYLSGHPLDEFTETFAQEGAQDIATLESGGCTICGMISGLIFKTTKKTGEPIAFFDLVDKTGSCEIKCWTREFKAYSNLLKEGAVVRIDGNCKIENEKDQNGEDISVEAEVHVRNMKVLVKQSTKKMLITCESIMDWQDRCYKSVEPYINNDGCACFINDKLMREIRKCTFRVSESILQAKIDGLSITTI